MKRVFPFAVLAFTSALPTWGCIGLLAGTDFADGGPDGAAADSRPDEAAADAPPMDGDGDAIPPEAESCPEGCDCAACFVGGGCGEGAPECTTCACPVTYGYPSITTVGDPSDESFTENYLLGELVVVSRAMTLTKLAVNATAAGPHVILALYEASGGPTSLVAATLSTLVAVGSNEIAVTPVALPAGNYWIMGVYDADAQIAIDAVTTNPIDYIALTFGTLLPNPWPPMPVTYKAVHIGYYLVGTE